jgi:hypothetical protein
VLDALASVGVPTSATSVHLFAPEDFLVVFSTAEFRNMVVARPDIHFGGFMLFFRQWNRQTQATQVNLRTKVLLAVEGMPPHAWETEVGEDLIGKSCDVLEVAPETRSRANMSFFKIMAWTSDLESVPVARTLVVTEPEEGLLPVGAQPTRRVVEPSGVVSLHYKVRIHVAAVEEDASVAERPDHGSLGGGPSNPSEEGTGAGGRRS